MHVPVRESSRVILPVPLVPVGAMLVFMRVRTGTGKKWTTCSTRSNVVLLGTKKSYQVGSSSWGRFKTVLQIDLQVQLRLQEIDQS